MKKFNKILILFLSFFIVFFKVNLKIDAQQPKEIENYISKAIIWDIGNGKEANKDGFGNYRLLLSTEYKLKVNFDLSRYNNDANGGLKNGDYFNISLPAPMNVVNQNFEFKDDISNTFIGDVEVTSAGERAGGNIKLTLKNLETYKNIRNTTTVNDVLGEFYVSFKYDQTVLTPQFIPFTSTTNEPINIGYTVTQKAVNDFSALIGSENFAKINGVLARNPYDSAILNKKSEYSHYWTVRLNARQATYNTITLEDKISENSAPSQIVPETLEVLKGQFNPATYALMHANNITKPAEKLREGQDYTVTYNLSYSAFELKILNAQNFAYVVRYKSTPSLDGSQIGNTIKVKVDDNYINARTVGSQQEFTATQLSKLTDGGFITIDTANRLVIYKVDEVTLERLPGAIFEVRKPNGDKLTLDPTDENGRTFNHIPFTPAEINSGAFTITEVQAPKGYKIDTTPVILNLNANGTLRTFKNKRLADVSGDKIWDDLNNHYNRRPNEITLNLKQNGTVVQTLQVSAITADPANPNRWTYDFGEYPYYDANGQKYNYEIEEIIPTGYVSQIDADNNITNKLELISVPVMKLWDGPKLNQVEVKVFNVKAPTVMIATKEISEATGWEATFDNLPKYNEDGSEAQYIVKETPIANYDTEVSGDQNTGFRIKNTNTEKISVNVNKLWNGPKLNQVEVKVFNVKAPTVMIATKEISEATGWEATFDNLPKYNEDGSEAQYNVVETPVANYESETDGNQTVGFTILNTNNEKVNVPVEKRWFGPKLDKIEVKLYNEKAPTQILQQVELKEANAWKHTFMNLPKYNEDGSEAKYLVEEVKLENYISEITGDQGSGYLITNRNIEKISIPVTKGWVGPKTSGVEVKIFHKDDEVNAIETVEITEAMNWKYVFKNLPKYNQDGSEAQYIVKETPIANYDTTIEGNSDLYIITNKNKETINVPVEKKWVGDKLDKVVVSVYNENNLEYAIQTKEITEETNWRYVFENLPKYNDNGSVAKYVVKEVEIADYTIEITGDQNGYVITNTKAIKPNVLPINPNTKNPVDTSDNLVEIGYMLVALLGFVLLKQSKH